MLYQQLDLGKVTLYGWEPIKSVEIVAAIAEGILLGDEIPPVQILFTKHGLVLDPFNQIIRGDIYFADGGHNRALAHYILGHPLTARIRDSNRPLKRNLIPIPEIQLISKPEDYFRRRSLTYYRELSLI